jgi:hypothetical protein
MRWKEKDFVNKHGGKFILKEKQILVKVFLGK